MSKSKKGKKFTMQGIFDFEKMQVTEITKDAKLLFDLAEHLKEFDGLEIKISVTTDVEIEPIN